MQLCRAIRLQERSILRSFIRQTIKCWNMCPCSSVQFVLQSNISKEYPCCICKIFTTIPSPDMMKSSIGNIFALLAICAGKSPAPGEFRAQRPVTRSFDVFFDLRLNKRLSKQWWGWWFETLSRPVWCQVNSPAPLFFRVIIIKILVIYCTSRSYLTGTAADWLRWYLSNIIVILTISKIAR